MPRRDAPRPDSYLVDGVEVDVRRSARRTRTISARHEGGRLVVMVPAAMSADQERRYVEQLARKVMARDARGPRGDTELEARARALSRRYLGGRAVPTSVRWSSRQQRRWGSCTPETGEIRIAESVRPLPREVADYVLLHELTHLLVPGHGPEFWAELANYPHLERARGFLDGVSFEAARRLSQRGEG